jgi:hypothetical protein
MSYPPREVEPGAARRGLFCCLCTLVRSLAPDAAPCLRVVVVLGEQRAGDKTPDDSALALVEIDLRVVKILVDITGERSRGAVEAGAAASVRGRRSIAEASRGCISA